MHYIKALKSTNKESIDLKLIEIDNNCVYAYIETIKVLDEKGNFKEIRIVITGIDYLKRSEYNKKYAENRYLLFQENLSYNIKFDKYVGTLCNQKNRQMVQSMG